MERAPPIDVQLARLCSPENGGWVATAIFREREAGVGSGVEGRGFRGEYGEKKGTERRHRRDEMRVRRKHARSVSGWR